MSDEIPQTLSQSVFVSSGSRKLIHDFINDFERELCAPLAGITKDERITWLTLLQFARIGIGSTENSPPIVPTSVSEIDKDQAIARLLSEYFYEELCWEPEQEPIEDWEAADHLVRWLDRTSALTRHLALKFIPESEAAE